MISRKHVFTAIVALCGIGGLRAATPLPPWYGDPDTTRQGHLFDSADLSPTADILEDVFAAPLTTVMLGTFSDGWQDPANPIQLSGADGDGTWDLGIGGSITSDVAVAVTAASPETYYQIDIHVYAIAYQGITALPALDTPGLTIDGLSLTQVKVADDTVFPGATWEGLTWTGTIDSLTDPNIIFELSAPAGNTSVVDRFEVFTRTTLIPEPSSTLMILAGIFAATIRRRTRN